MMRDHIRDVWKELEATPPQGSSLVKRRILADLPAPLFAAIRYPEGARTLLLQLPVGTVRSLSGRLVQMRGVRTQAVLPTSDSEVAFVAVTLVEPRLSDPFDVLVTDLADALARPMPEHQQGLTLVDRLEHWRELFASYRGEELSLQARKGLYGELRWLQHIIESGAIPEVAVGSWQGSPGGDQDFICGGGAVEIKTTEEGESLSVDSERQLDESGFDRLVLVHQTVRAAETGRTLPEEVDVVRALVGPGTPAGQRLETRLAQIGYSDAHRDRYEDVRYVHDDTRAYTVSGTFPRLTPSSLPAGIQGVSYRVHPSACAPFQSDPSDAASLFR